jgi:drug/metabolite transporter (DMT)-like permease
LLGWSCTRGGVSNSETSVSLDTSSVDARRPLGVALCLGALYLIWGSTYLAIRFAIETLPPLLMAGSRFVIAGGILYTWSRVRGSGKPGGALWKTAAASGTLMLLGGNGAVVWAEQFVPSGLVALLIATVPLWLVLQDWVSARGARPSPGVVFGLLWGFGGVAILVTGSEIGRAGPSDLLGGVLVLAGAGCWAAGSLIARYGPRPASAAQGNGMQMLAGGFALLVAGILRGEPATFQPTSVSLASGLALAYLIVFGSLVAFSSYIWLLRNTTPAIASTYAYVNPIVALLLGWALADEPLSPRTGLAGFVILSAVMVITLRPRGILPGPRGPDRPRRG